MSATGTAREEHQSMEFSVTKSALLNELSTTQGVVERKTTIPILSNLLVEAKGSHLTITATDLELSVRTSCEAKIKKEGAGTIPAKKLLELVRLLPEGEIKVRLLENHWVEIVSDRKKYKLVGMAKENFPALPTMPHTLVKISAPVLESLIAKTKFAISMEESRYTLNGPRIAALAFFVYLPLTIGIAYLFHVNVERPFMEKRAAKTKAPAEQLAEQPHGAPVAR